MGTYETRTDIAKNRLYFKLDGFLSDAEAITIAEKVVAEARRLRPPFDVISDLTAFKPATPQGSENFKQAAAAIVKLGTRKMVRVDSTSGAGSLQFSRISKTTGYEVIIVKTLQEAEELLDTLS